MGNSVILMLIFFGLLVCLSILFYTYTLQQKKKAEIAQLLLEKDQLKLQFDQARKEKIDLQDQVTLAQGQEKTYKVAYEDWKSKYSLLEEKYLQLRKEIDQHSIKKTQGPEVSEVVIKTTEHLPISNKPISEIDGNKIIGDLKTILDQHLAIISGLIGEEDFQKITKPQTPMDPLHWIQGMGPDIIQKLSSDGIRSFDQLAKASKKDVRKWMMEFEDVDEKVIESWPLQAAAIKASKSNI